ncbi:hypothetical protein [Alloprevotella tannerae]|uniref:hypothetical protein n=1 Tax=Alloprevotella tannerae TaxID=76122 RepID=UPI00288ACC2A|nr:hypothetical protein [Alloprevotella tannerae]
MRTKTVHLKAAKCSNDDEKRLPFLSTQQKQTTDERLNTIAISTLAQAALPPDVFYHDNKGVRS